MNAEASQVHDWSLPEKLGFFFYEKHRFKVAYGGRDGAKSWSAARALLLLGGQQPLRIGCFREIQEDLDSSVYKLLKDQIYNMGLGGSYTCLRDRIRGVNGTEFIFEGLSNQTKDSIKSFEGIDIAWIEEAHSISEGSWDILEPTIRKKGSEIWVTFNPSMDTDFIYRYFVTNPPDEAKVVKVNWSDNPWRSEVLDKARKRMQEQEPEKYDHIYEGNCKAAIEGAIYFKEVTRLREQGRLHAVPYDPMLKVHVVVDLGFNDYTSLLLVQRLASEIRIIRYIEDRLRDIPSYSQELKELKHEGRGLNFGKIWLPHDAYAKRLEAANNPNGVTTEQQFAKLGWTCEKVPEIDIEQGILKARSVFPRVHMDKDNAIELLNRLGRYHRRINKVTKQATTPVHDDHSHGSDGFRYLALVADQLSNDDDGDWNKKLKYENRGIV